jgi:exodeoxyribonuclease VII large subunit
VTDAADAPQKRIYSVSELGRALRNHLEKKTAGIEVCGDVTGLKGAESGHAYFALRDDREEASIDCVLYRSGPVRSRRLLVEGTKVIVTGRITFWPPRGRAQFVVEAVRAAGRGALLEQLEKLKAKLLAEGLFEPARKRRLPSDPRVIGVVTSGQGAALHDIVKVAFERGPARILLSPAPVQGAGAAAALVRALSKLLRHPEVDVVILGRGGGSQDDLAPFNEEELVRAVVASSVPIVSAVGHEVDTTLVDLAADVRAATPSQAAELVVADSRARTTKLELATQRLSRSLERTLRDASQRTDELFGELEQAAKVRLGQEKAHTQELARRMSARHPTRVLRAFRLDVGQKLERMNHAMQVRVQRAKPMPSTLRLRLDQAIRSRLDGERSTVERRVAALEALSPLSVLTRGYAVVRKRAGRTLVRDATVLAPGERLAIDFAQGTVVAEVVEVLPKPGDEA